MGVKGLLKALAEIQREAHISQYKGRRVGIDGYIYLHQGKYSSASDILLGTGEPKPEKCLGPLLALVAALRMCGAEPIVVFDGAPLPAKKSTDEARRASRERAKAKALAEWRATGRMTCSTAAAAVEVTRAMVQTCIGRLRAMDVAFVVAPCESDAQLAYMATSSLVDVVVTRDADLLVYGCPRVVFDLQLESGRCCEIHLADVGRVRSLQPYALKPASLPDLCVLAGCDYLESVAGLGLKTAAKLLHKAAGCTKRVMTLARREVAALPEDFERTFRHARLVYTSQVVFDPVAQRLRHLLPPPADVEVPAGHLGPSHCPETACRIAFATIHPVTLEPFSDLSLPEPSALGDRGAILADEPGLVECASSSGSEHLEAPGLTFYELTARGELGFQARGAAGNVLADEQPRRHTQATTPVSAAPWSALGGFQPVWPRAQSGVKPADVQNDHPWASLRPLHGQAIPAGFDTDAASAMDGHSLGTRSRSGSIQSPSPHAMHARHPGVYREPATSAASAIGSQSNSTYPRPVCERCCASMAATHQQHFAGDVCIAGGNQQRRLRAGVEGLILQPKHAQGNPAATGQLKKAQTTLTSGCDSAEIDGPANLLGRALPLNADRRPPVASAAVSTATATATVKEEEVMRKAQPCRFVPPRTASSREVLPSGAAEAQEKGSPQMKRAFLPEMQAKPEDEQLMPPLRRRRLGCRVR
eukprot:TRINITY_DN36073_c0_g1_i3.p1 TRINITY_DN36073_c0_g1~~TRINITY_DN36073_c0_g1_i3.p1  ORF type:complete len:704 (+),score=136.93 TRINITY_DN36073_c0_g1_i3:59-2170(+)